MRLTIDIDGEIDQEASATILEAVAKALREEDMESRELMDGSYRVDTPHGPAFLARDEEGEASSS
jgi:hypothetical protein